MTDDQKLTVIVLAARRDGRHDPLAAAHGVSHKHLVMLGDRPLIGHVLDALAATPEVDRIRISIEDRSDFAGVPQVAELEGAGRLDFVRSEPGLLQSVEAAVAGVRYPVVITTGDNVNLKPEHVRQVDREARRARADVAVALARKEDVLRAHPQGQRRFYHFSDGGVSNCNLYWLGNPAALAAASVFREGGQFARNPGRVMRAFGLSNLIRLRFGIGRLHDAFARLSRRFRLTIIPVVVPEGALAIDVDNQKSYEVNKLLRGLA